MFLPFQATAHRHMHTSLSGDHMVQDSRIRNDQKRQIHRDRKEIGGLLQGGEGMSSDDHRAWVLSEAMKALKMECGVGCTFL